MPPKAKFTREQIVSAALRIVERDGVASLTARTLGSELGSSARPVFTVFESMDEVQAAVRRAAHDEYAMYVENGLRESIAFRGVGRAYIKFAAEHTELFKLLFMSERCEAPNIQSVIDVIDGCADKIRKSIVDGYGVCVELAERLYIHLWIYTHGIATLIATGVCKFTEREISDMMTDVFKGVFRQLTATESEI